LRVAGQLLAEVPVRCAAPNDIASTSAEQSIHAVGNNPLESQTEHEETAEALVRAVMAADPAHLFPRLSERQGIMAPGWRLRERACQGWTSCLTMSCTALRAAAVLLGGLRRVNSGVPIRASVVITPNRSCGLSAWSPP